MSKLAYAGIGGAVGAGLLYAVAPQREFAGGYALAGGLIGALGGSWLAMSRALESESDPETPPHPSKIVVPPPPTGRPIIPQEAEMMFGGQSPTLGCTSAHQSYYGVHSWGQLPDGNYEPQWQLLGRWKGSVLTQAMLPMLDQYYGAAHDCQFQLGVWAVGVGCAGEYRFYQVGRDAATCAVAKR